LKKSVFVLLVGSKEPGQTDEYQLLQEQVALAEARRAGLEIEVVFAPAFDQLRMIRRRLHEARTRAVDAVVTEPASASSIDMLLRDLRGKTGLVLLNAWGPAVEESASAWGDEHPFGTISTDHARIGEIQGAQVAGFVPKEGNLLCVTGPQRSAAAEQRLAGLKSVLRRDIRVFETAAGEWTEADGIKAFHGWYGVFKARNDSIHAVAAQSDELAFGAKNAGKALQNQAHREMFARAKYLGVDACPNYGRRLVDSGDLAASIVTPPNTDLAIASLSAFWSDRKRLPIRVLTKAAPYPASSAPGA